MSFMKRFKRFGVLIVVVGLLGGQMAPLQAAMVGNGELLQQAWANFSAWWLGFAVITAMVVTLVAVTFVGEAVREAFDPKMHTVYE